MFITYNSYSAIKEYAELEPLTDFLGKIIHPHWVYHDYKDIVRLPLDKFIDFTYDRDELFGKTINHLEHMAKYKRVHALENYLNKLPGKEVFYIIEAFFICEKTRHFNYTWVDTSEFSFLKFACLSVRSSLIDFSFTCLSKKLNSSEVSHQILRYNENSLYY